MKFASPLRYGIYAGQSYYRSFSLGRRDHPRLSRIARSLTAQLDDRVIKRLSFIPIAPFEVLDELESIEKEITQGMKQLRGMLN